MPVAVISRSRIQKLAGRSSTIPGDSVAMHTILHVNNSTKLQVGPMSDDKPITHVGFGRTSCNCQLVFLGVKAIYNRFGSFGTCIGAGQPEYGFSFGRKLNITQ